MIKARIRQFNGGRYGRTGEWIAMIEPEFFKNGNMKKSQFKIIEKLEEIKKPYRYAGATESWQIVELL